MLHRITAPVPFTGAGVGGVEFVDGVAETDNGAVVDYCRNAGYVVELVAPKPAAKKAAAKRPSK